MISDWFLARDFKEIGHRAALWTSGVDLQAWLVWS
jgi:hypothetical protein